MTKIDKVICTQQASDFIEFLKEKHGPLMFHQSVGAVMEFTNLLSAG